MRRVLYAILTVGFVACSSSGPSGSGSPAPPPNRSDAGTPDGGSLADGGTGGGGADAGTPDGGTGGGGGAPDGGTTDGGTGGGGTPDGGHAVILWQQSFPDAARVGSDWNQQIVAASGSVLMRLDPATGQTTASHDFNESGAAAGSVYFVGRLGIAPGTSTVWGTLRSGADQRVVSNLCAFNFSGSKDCVQGATDELHLTPMILSPDGSVGWGTGPFSYDAYALAPDGTKTTVPLWSSNQYDGTELVGVARESNGDLVVAVHAGSDFTVDGQKLGPSDALFRIAPDGHLVWWHKVPFTILDLGISTTGTVVMVGTSAAGFTWGGQSAKGTALVVADASGTERFARQLVDSVADSAVVSVLPVGRVAIALNRPSCGGADVFRYDLAGNQTWQWDLASHGCDVTISSVSILPDDVLVAGAANEDTDLGAGTLHAGGFVLELGAGP